MNDLDNPGFKQQELRKQLFRLARNDVKRSQKVDPYAVLSNISNKELSFGDVHDDEESTYFPNDYLFE